MSNATMSTNHGDITFELFDEDAPKTVENFRKLADDGFYDGLIVPPHHPRLHDPGRLPAGHRHRRPGLQFEDEINQHKVARGALAMANAGPNTNGSQFFIVTHRRGAVAGRQAHRVRPVTDGMDVVDKLEGLPTDARDRPREDAKIEKLTHRRAHGHRARRRHDRRREPRHRRDHPRGAGDAPRTSRRSSPAPARPSPAGRRSATRAAAGS